MVVVAVVMMEIMMCGCSGIGNVHGEGDGVFLIITDDFNDGDNATVLPSTMGSYRRLSF